MKVGVTDISLSGLITIKYTKPVEIREIVTGLPDKFLSLEISRFKEDSIENCPEISGLKSEIENFEEKELQIRIFF